MSNKDNNDRKKMEKAGKMLEAIVAATDLHGHYQEAMKQKELLAQTRQEMVYETRKKQRTPKDIAIERMTSMNSKMEAAHDEQEKERKRRLEQFQKEEAAGKMAREKEAVNKDRAESAKKKEQLQMAILEKARTKDQNNKEVLNLEKKQSDLERRKNEIGQKQKENKVEISRKKDNERM